MDFLPSFAPWQWALAAGAAAIVAFLQWPSIKAGFSWATAGRKTSNATGIPTRREVLDYLDLSYSFFDSIECKEGMKAISEAVTHAFAEHDAEGNVTEPGAK